MPEMFAADIRQWDQLQSAVRTNNESRLEPTRLTAVQQIAILVHIAQDVFSEMHQQRSFNAVTAVFLVSQQSLVRSVTADTKVVDTVTNQPGKHFGPGSSFLDPGRPRK